MDLLTPIFSESNSARFVDRNNQRMPIFSLPYLEERQARLGGEMRNPLQRFAGHPLAIVINEQTASAGEMLAIMLLGEGERARSFGWPTYGLTTANRQIPLPDNAMLVLSSARYGVADAPAIRGKIQPQVAAARTDDMPSILMRAATWAARHTSLCAHSVNPPRQD